MRLDLNPALCGSRDHGLVSILHCFSRPGQGRALGHRPASAPGNLEDPASLHGDSRPRGNAREGAVAISGPAFGEISPLTSSCPPSCPVLARSLWHHDPGAQTFRGTFLLAQKGINRRKGGGVASPAHPAGSAHLATGKPFAGGKAATAKCGS